MSESMNEKTVRTRIVHKHDIEANWQKAVNFVPKQGELIIYDDRYFDEETEQTVIVANSIRHKIGDGVTNVNDLPFADLISAGEGKNSIQQENAIALAEDSAAFGSGTTAGCRCYTIKDWDYITRTYKLDEDVTDKYEIGDIFSIRDYVVYESGIGKYNYLHLFFEIGKITNVDGDTITVDTFFEPREDSVGGRAPSLFVFSKPYYGTTTCGDFSIVAGDSTQSAAAYGTALGRFSLVVGNAGVAEGHTTVASDYAHAENNHTKALGRSSHAEGRHTITYSQAAHSEGEYTRTYGTCSHVEGSHSVAGNPLRVNDIIYLNDDIVAAHAEGIHTLALATGSHTEGGYTRTGYRYTKLSTSYSETGPISGVEVLNDGIRFTVSTIENVKAGDILLLVDNSCGRRGLLRVTQVGEDTRRIKVEKTAEAESITAIFIPNDHEEQRDMSRLINLSNPAFGDLYEDDAAFAHAEGRYTIAAAPNTHVEGEGTIALAENVHVQGKYNKLDASRIYAHIVGNGTDTFNRSNAHTLDWGGNAWFAGDVTIGNDHKKLATEPYVDKAIKELIDGAPGTLDTLKEIAEVLGEENDVGGLVHTVAANSKAIESHKTDISNLDTRLTQNYELKESTLYVSTTGDDANPGTCGAPLRSIKTAIDRGATHIAVFPGTYYEKIGVAPASEPNTLRKKLHIFTYVTGSNKNYAFSKAIIDGRTSETDETIARGMCGQFKYVKEVILENLVFQYASSTVCEIKNCDNFRVDNCEFHHSAGSDGLSIDSSSGTLTNVTASNNHNDGINLDGKGSTTIINAYCHHNGLNGSGDGVSHHHGYSGSIIGGEFCYNTKGGVSSPTYGSKIDIHNVYTHDNGYGIYAHCPADSNDSKIDDTIKVFSSSIKNNRVGILAEGYKIYSYNNLLDGNLQDHLLKNSGEIIQDDCTHSQTLNGALQAAPGVGSFTQDSCRTTAMKYFAGSWKNGLKHFYVESDLFKGPIEGEDAWILNSNKNLIKKVTNVNVGTGANSKRIVFNEKMSGNGEGYIVFPNKPLVNIYKDRANEPEIEHTINHAVALGCGTIATNDDQLVIGTYNDRTIDDLNEKLFVIGNGTVDENRSNAATVDRNGNAWFAGDVRVGDKDKLISEAEVNKLLDILPPTEEGLIYNNINDTTCYVSGIMPGYNLTEINIPSAQFYGDGIGVVVTQVFDSAFSNCGQLTRVILPDSITNIDTEAFYNCTGLTSITIPSSVTSIGSYAFSGCTGLEEIYFNAESAELATPLFDYTRPFERAGQNGNGIKVIIGKDVTSIPNGLFYCPNQDDPDDFTAAPKIVSVEFEEGSVCESIGSYAFAGCKELTSIIIPSSVTSIGSYAFEGCDALTIYCEAEMEPEYDGWGSNWNYSNCPVVWGYSVEDFNKVKHEYVTEAELEDKKYLTEVPSEYITETELNTYLQDYTTESALNESISDIKGKLATTVETIDGQLEIINNNISNDISSINSDIEAITDEVETINTKINTVSGDVAGIKDDYATKDYLESNYTTTTDLEANYASYDSLSTELESYVASSGDTQIKSIQVVTETPTDFSQLANVLTIVI